ncbi:MAG: T9SS type A sorting domain-containing protein [Cytophagaceae bacterium]|nr:MAG: T9SS type A sorting domain-containing protein [Cytophagaceae bacterium]
MNAFRFLVIGLLLLPALAKGQSFFDSNLPIILIDTRGGTIVDDPKIVADMRIIDNGTGKRNVITDKASFSSVIGIELRGATSQLFFPKKPYGIELRDSTGINSVTKSVLGMPSESDWVLNATYSDKTLVRETLTYDFYRKMSPYYASRFRYCELVLNGEYKGIYILMERLKRDKNRVNITSIKKTDITGDAVTGGYILKIDKTEGSASVTWTSPYTAGSSRVPVRIQIDRPKPEDLAPEQIQYISRYVTDFENALNGPDFADPDKGFRKFADEDSFIDYLLLTEICKNVDGYRLSAYFYKDRDSKNPKIVMGPIWDYNLTYGNADYCDGNSYTGWSFDYNTVCPKDIYSIPFWWNRLLQDLTFGKKVKAKYKALRQTILTPQRLGTFVDSTTNLVTEARIRNFTKWPVIGVYVWPNGYVGSTYQKEVDYLKDWITQRLGWMDTAIEQFGVAPLATEPNALRLGPNPSVGDVLVTLPLPDPTEVVLTLTDMQGRSVHQVRWPNQPAGMFERTLAADQFTRGPGTYVLTVTTQSGPVSKVIVRY